MQSCGVRIITTLKSLVDFTNVFLLVDIPRHDEKLSMSCGLGKVVRCCGLGKEWYGGGGDVTFIVCG
jgi:hypothetical protein